MRKKYEKIDLKFISKETNKIRGKNYIQIRARKRAQIILSNVYYPSNIVQVILYKLNIQVVLYKLNYSSYIIHYRSYIIGIVL